MKKKIFFLIEMFLSNFFAVFSVFFCKNYYQTFLQNLQSIDTEVIIYHTIRASLSPIFSRVFPHFFWFSYLFPSKNLRQNNCVLGFDQWENFREFKNLKKNFFWFQKFWKKFFLIDFVIDVFTDGNFIIQNFLKLNLFSRIFWK